MRSRRVVHAALALAVGASLSGCAGLRDQEPFTVTVVYDEDLETGRLTVTPITFTGDWSYGEVQVLNKTDQEHGFAVRELAVFEKIPKGLSKIVRVDEARDGRTYTFECQLHDGEFAGKMVITHKPPEERE